MIWAVCCVTIIMFYLQMLSTWVLRNNSTMRIGSVHLILGKIASRWQWSTSPSTVPRISAFSQNASKGNPSIIQKHSWATVSAIFGSSHLDSLTQSSSDISRASQYLTSVTDKISICADDSNSLMGTSGSRTSDIGIFVGRSVWWGSHLPPQCYHEEGRRPLLNVSAIGVYFANNKSEWCCASVEFGRRV